MKIFKFLTIASIGLISLGFTSCSDDDDAPAENKPEELTVKKRLKSMTYVVEDNRTPGNPTAYTTRLSDFTYDGDGKILSYKESRESKSPIDGTPMVNTETMTYNYSNNKINDYVLSDGLICTYDDGFFKYSYTYDNNHLTRYYNPTVASSAYTFDWEAGVKRILCKGNHQTEDMTYTYIDKICPSSMVYYGFAYLPYYDCDIDPILADAGYFGEKMYPKLIGEYSLQHSDGRIWGSVFAYEFDNDGYVTSMTVVGTGERVGRDCKYTYVWE